MKNGYNIRIPLPNGLQITDSIIIESLLSQAGGSSLTYLCKNKDGIRYVLKEIYPLISRIPLVRKGYAIIVDDEKRRKDNVEIIELAFKNEKENQGYLCDAGTSNSIHHFTFNDITNEVKKRLSAENSLSHYLLFETKKGYTLSELIEKHVQQSKQFSTQEALTYVQKIANALKRMHDEKRYLHLDIKPDNLFFPSELIPNDDITNITNTFCILLDSGTATSIKSIKQQEKAIGIISLSVDYAARELRHAANALRNMNEVSPEKRKEKFYKFYSQTGMHSDLYSLLAVLLNLLLGESEYTLIWKDKTISYQWKDILEQDHNELRSLEIENAIHSVEPRKGVANELTRIVCKGLYFDIDNISELSKCRYKNCDELIKDVNDLIKDIERKGVGENSILENCRYQLNEQFRKNGIQNVSFENIHELPIDPDLIPDGEII